MKSIIPDPAQLDELADGLDAGWDDEPAQKLPSQPPHSSPLPEALAALDAEWEVAAKPPAPAAAPARAGQSRPNAARPSSARPNPTRAVTPPVSGGPVRLSKQQRRDAERKRRAHEAQQKSANKKQRKAERQAEAQRASEQLRAAEQQALAERRARQGVARKRPQPKVVNTEPAATPKRVARAAAARTLPALESLPAQRVARPIVEERGAKKLIVPLLIALLFAVTLGFALSRAR